MIEVKQKDIKKNIEIKVPGSKSYTHRMLIAAALSDGVSVLDNCLRSEDTLLTQKTLMILPKFSFGKGKPVKNIFSP